MIKCLSRSTAGGDGKSTTRCNRPALPPPKPPQSVAVRSKLGWSRTGTSSRRLGHLLTCSLSQQVTIGKLSDKVLLKIITFYLDVSPRFWPRHVHICRRWRRIVFASQRALHLRLFFTHGTPVLKALDYWPALPIVMEYGGAQELDPPAPEDEDNIIAALTQAGRVTSISLAVTRSLLEKLSAIERPLSALEALFLKSRDSLRVTLPSAFGRSTQLRHLRLTGIAFFALPHLLYSSRNLIDLHLDEVLNLWLLSPEALTDALSGMTQLRSLSLNILPSQDHIGVSVPSRKRIVLPALTHLIFQGIPKYLEDLMAGIDTPRLEDIRVMFSYKSITDFTELYKFIDRIEAHKSHRRADILSSERAIFISLTQPKTPTRLQIKLFCKPLSTQISSMAQICRHLSAFLLNVEDLCISTTQNSRGQADSGRQQWLRLIHPFRSTKWLHVAGVYSKNIVHALQSPDRQRQTVLPALHKLHIVLQPGSGHTLSREVVLSFMHSRRLSGHLVAVEYERLCEISELGGTGIVDAPCNHHPLTPLW